MYLLQVYWCEAHSSQQFPHGLGKMEVQWLLGPHGYPQQDAKELEVLVVPGCSGFRIQHKAVSVEATRVGRVWGGDQQIHYSILQLLEESIQITDENIELRDSKSGIRKMTSPSYT